MVWQYAVTATWVDAIHGSWAGNSGLIRSKPLWLPEPLLKQARWRRRGNVADATVSGGQRGALRGGRYKLEGYNLFLEMMANIRRNVIYNCFVFQPRRNPDATPPGRRRGHCSSGTPLASPNSMPVF